MKVESGKLKLRYMTIKKKTKREKTKKKVKKRLKLGRERERDGRASRVLLRGHYWLTRSLSLIIE